LQRKNKMATKNYTVAYRRKRECKTDYRKRLKLLSSKKTRLVVRKTLNNIIVQFVNSKGQDHVVCGVTASKLRDFGWNYGLGNTPAAYLTGLLAGKIAKKKNISEAILDMGLQSKTSERLFAALKGVLDAEINVPHTKEILPDESRIKGKHIAEYYEKVKKEGIPIQFSTYKPRLVENFEEVKNKILKQA